MNIWDILKIESTTDIERIKMAYDKTLEEYSADNDSDKFAQLQLAYREAVRLALTIDNENLGKQKEAFWNDMDAIIWNPYLRNDLRAWEYLFSGPEYSELFKNDVFRDEFALRFCKEKHIWKAATARYIDKRLSEIRGGTGTAYETSRRAFHRLMYFEPFSDIMVFKKCCTNEEKQFYDKLMEKNKAKLQNDNDFIMSLHDYLKLAVTQREKLELIHNKSLTARKRKTIGALAGIAAILVMVLIFIATIIVNSNSIETYRKYKKAYKAFEERYPDYPYDLDVEGLDIEEIDRELDAVFETYDEWYNENAEDILNNFNK